MIKMMAEEFAFLTNPVADTELIQSSVSIQRISLVKQGLFCAKLQVMFWPRS